jgi:hypothetical protein
MIPPALLAVLAAGCAGPAETPEAGDLLGAMSISDSERTVRRLTGADRGLEVRKWIVDDDASTIAEALRSHARGTALDEATTRRLRGNGLRLVRVDAASLDALAADLGGPTYDANAWFGQVFTWREVLRHALPAAGQTLAIDGRPRRLERGTLRLGLRSWTVATEAGAIMQLELLPWWEPPPTGQDLRPLLGQPRVFRGRHLTALWLEVSLEPGAAYVLTCESPQVDWDGDDASAGRGGRPASRRLGPLDTIGSDAVAATTFGERMLRSAVGPPGRGVLVFVPRLDDPSAAVPAGSAPGDAS